MHCRGRNVRRERDIFGSKNIRCTVALKVSSIASSKHGMDNRVTSKPGVPHTELGKRAGPGLRELALRNQRESGGGIQATLGPFTSPSPVRLH